jgi:uncharacterized protein YndB with AHSA1/START domain
LYTSRNSYLAPLRELNTFCMSEKTKIELEFLLNASPKSLYSMISTPSGLSEWFADDVNVRDDDFTFIWDGSEEMARLVRKVKDQSVRFQWDYDEGEEYYFELRIKVDGITQEVAIIVTDFVEKGDKESTSQLWESQIEDLRRLLGA